jgi:hypothetical protein
MPINPVTIAIVCLEKDKLNPCCRQKLGDRNYHTKKSIKWNITENMQKQIEVEKLV